MPRRTTRSSASLAERCARAGRHQIIVLRGCQPPAITRCIRSSSTPKAISSSISARRRIPARCRTGCLNRPASSLARNSKPAPASGATAPTRLGQTFSPAGRYATGIRNGEGFGFDAAGRLFVTQHGRDQLWQNWPKLYTPESQRRTAGRGTRRTAPRRADFGWPECYFDGYQKRLVLAPEYGGDGGRTPGVCAGKKQSGRFLSGALGAERSADRQFGRVSGGLSRRRLHRLSRFVESRAAAAGRL